MTTVIPTVHEVLTTRKAAASRPGARSDDYRVALAIEGGGNRAAFSAGMALALDELGLLASVDAVYGTSGGALNGAWLLTGDGQRFLPSWGWPTVAAAGVSDVRRLMRGGPLVDLNRLVGHVYEQVTPMDFEAIRANPITFHPIATDARTGEATDLAPYIEGRRTLQTALRASTCLPLLAGRPVRLGGRDLVDGGLSEAIPFVTAVQHGATHVLIFRTRREDQMASGSAVERLALAPYFAAFARGAGHSHRRRHLTYRAADHEASRPSSGTQFLQVRPPLDAHTVSRLSRDLGGIAEAIVMGRAAALAALDPERLGHHEATVPATS